MKPIYKSLVDIAIWIFFFKGAALVPVTLYIFFRAFLFGDFSVFAGIASCAAGTFAFGLGCAAIWIRDHLKEADKSGLR